jgi:hypothetical protein
METGFTNDEKALLKQAFQLRESQTEEQRATMRAEFEVNLVRAGRLHQTG